MWQAECSNVYVPHWLDHTSSKFKVERPYGTLLSRFEFSSHYHFLWCACFDYKLHLLDWNYIVINKSTVKGSKEKAPPASNCSCSLCQGHKKAQLLFMKWYVICQWSVLKTHLFTSICECKKHTFCRIFIFSSLFVFPFF